VAKPDYIELAESERIPILYEDRSVLVIDKPRGWMLAPSGWRKTSRNLQLALTHGIRFGELWARSRNLNFIRFVHRLDAETTGVLMLGKSPGAVSTFSRLFETRQVTKVYLTVVAGTPPSNTWTCRLKLSPDARRPGRVRVDEPQGKEAQTCFQVLDSRPGMALLEARPLTGRMHQIRVHLAAAGCPVLGDGLYGKPSSVERPLLALRAVALSYRDPFSGSPVHVQAPRDPFLAEHGLA
jgi:RluA family pseudouridine synthase